MIDLARLASTYDEDSRDTYLSLYVDLTDDARDREIDRRVKEIRAALDADADGLQSFEASLARARGALGEMAGRGAQGAAVFCSEPHDFLEAHPLAQPVPTRIVLDSSPYVRPLARYEDEYESFVLALIDGERAAIYLVDEGRADLEAQKRMDLIGRHKKGGMSQMRFQRHRQGLVDKLLDEVVERIERLVDEGEAERVLLAGPGQTKRQLHARMPEALRARVIAVEDADFSDEGARDRRLVQRFIELARAHESDESAAAVERLKGELKRGELALTGAFEVARAARDGRVALLVILKGQEAGGAKCEEHQTYFEAGATCACGNAGTRVDLLNEAVEGAARAESRIEFVDDAPFLERVGGAGALLRW